MNYFPLQLSAIRLPTQYNTLTPKTKPRTSLSNPYNHFSNEKIFIDTLHSLSISIDHKDHKLGSCFHANIVKLGIENDAFIGNSLLNMYLKCDQFDDGVYLFDQMSQRTVVSWTTMILGYCNMGLPYEALVLFCQMLECLEPNEYTLAVMFQACAQMSDGRLIKNGHGYAVKKGFIADGFLLNALLDGYIKLGMLDGAEMLLERYCCGDVVSWTTVISGCVNAKMVEKAFMLFSRMRGERVRVNEVTILGMLQACSESRNEDVLRWGHGLVLRGGWCWNPDVVSSLVEMYSTNGCFIEAIEVFQEFCFGNEGLYLSPETMATLVRNCSNTNLFEPGKTIHGYLIKNGFLCDTMIDNSLMNMYSENGDNGSAWSIFTRVKEKDIISWNTIIRCFVKNEQPNVALNLLTRIHSDASQEGVTPDFITSLACLQACSDLASLEQGQTIHGYIFKLGFLRDIFVQNALIDMYAKSGKLVLAERIFREMHERDVGSWNSMIAAYGIHGKGLCALQTYEHLCASELHRPNVITMVNIISACAHTGMVAEGLQIFNSMNRAHGIEPSSEHFACVVDLLGRSGRFKEAEAFIAEMPIEASNDVWGALLGASVVRGDIEVAERAANMLSIIEPSETTWRVALSNAYAAIGRWNDVARIRSEVRGSKQLAKEGGWSIINLQGSVFRFMAGDTRHPDSRLIYDVLSVLQNQLRDPSLHNVST
ncbi:hypothetical protein Leryth_008932 [Lithospermum erythrorhizon]|nr:hypothetical protein Leryth_008932 [Lithospermum erythrorhizon]